MLILTLLCVQYSSIDFCQEGLKLEYSGDYEVFDNLKINTYPISERKNKSSISNFINCDELSRGEILFPDEKIEEVAKAIVYAHKNRLPVIIITGAHPIKNGLSPIYIDWLKRGVVTLMGTTGAGVIHDFEYALMGETSEDVRGVLSDGDFGMAFETNAYINQALIEGNKKKLGFGESIGRFYWDKKFRKTVLNNVLEGVIDSSKYITPYESFQCVESSIIATAYKHKIPFTIHISIGTDIIDQHCNFDGEAKGGTSGRDFLVFVNEISKMENGGVFLNIGSAVTGPEVFLKAVSMVANVGKVPDEIICADFDLRPLSPDDEAKDDSRFHYYFRDQKSVVTRIPKVFSGRGFYIEGDHRKTLLSLYQYFMKHL